jgi:hypothetical protein
VLIILNLSYYVIFYVCRDAEIMRQKQKEADERKKQQAAGTAK